MGRELQWPRDWDAEFKLLAPGAFLISATQTAGQILAIEIISNVGSPCQLENPWGDKAVFIERENRPRETARGPRLQFATAEGERVILRPATSP